MSAGIGIGPIVGEAILDTSGFRTAFGARRGCSPRSPPSCRRPCPPAHVLPAAEPIVDARRPERTTRRRAALAAPRRRSAPGIVLAIGMAAFAVFTAFLPDYSRSLGLSGSGGLFAVYSAVCLVLRIVGARLPERLGPRPSVTIAFTMLGLGLALLAAVPEPWALWVAAVLRRRRHGVHVPVADGAHHQPRAGARAARGDRARSRCSSRSARRPAASRSARSPSRSASAAGSPPPSACACRRVAAADRRDPGLEPSTVASRCRRSPARRRRLRPPLTPPLIRCCPIPASDAGRRAAIMVAMALDHEPCYRAVTSRDARFDGCFVAAVRTTGIYCRPSCPAVTPKRANVEFFPTAAAAHEHGYRACKRCRPDASPGSPEWDVRADVVARAMRLIADGVVDREGVAGLARRLHYSERHLNRLVTDELGAGPLAIARAQRAKTARVLIETTTMPFTAIAFAAGFGSVRQFNDTVRAVFAASPTAAAAPRDAAASAADRGGGDRRRGHRRPRRAPAVRPRHGARLPRGAGRSRGVEHFDGASYHRVARAAPRPRRRHRRRRARRQGRPDRTCASTLRLADWRDLAPAVRRVRRLLDLDADPVAIDAALGADPVLAAARRAAARAARAGQRRPVRDRRAGRRRPAGLGRAARARSPAGSSPPSATPLAHRRRSRSRTCSRRPPRSPRSTRRCCRCRAAAGRTLIELAAGSPSARSRSTPAPIATRCAPRCSTCPASVRGPPTTC